MPHSPFGGCEWYKMARSSLESGNEVSRIGWCSTPLASQEAEAPRLSFPSSQAEGWMDGWGRGARIERVHGEPQPTATTHTPNNRLCGSAARVLGRLPRSVYKYGCAPVACSLPVTTCQSVGQHAGGAAGCETQSAIRRGCLAGIDRVLPLHAEMKWLPLEVLGCVWKQ